jgi:hypothetical protein
MPRVHRHAHFHHEAERVSFGYGGNGTGNLATRKIDPGFGNAERDAVENISPRGGRERVRSEPIASAGYTCDMCIRNKKDADYRHP